jgi:hypothetical protein
MCIIVGLNRICRKLWVTKDLMTLRKIFVFLIKKKNNQMIKFGKYDSWWISWMKNSRSIPFIN